MTLLASALKKHSTLVLHKDIAAICQDFFKKYNYCILNFIRRYDDGRVFYLCDNNAWMQHYLLNGYPSIGAFEQNPTLVDQEHVLWSALSDNDPVVIYSREMFNIRYGVTLVCRFSGGYDFFNFGTSQDERAVLGQMSNQLEELQKFTKLFYEKTKRIIAANQNSYFKLDEFNCKSEAPIIETNRLYLGPAYDYAYLTSKEVDCLKNLIVGKTIPEIADVIAASTRTIEKHVEHIKEKLNCKTQCELGYLAARLGIKV